MIDAELEHAIVAAGRDRVFDLARANGLAYPNSPPKWVWWELVMQANELTKAQTRVDKNSMDQTTR